MIDNYIMLYITSGVCIFLLTWVLFIIIMRVKGYPKPFVYLFLPIGIIGWLLDVIWNVFWATLIFWQLPDIKRGMRLHDVTLSHRLRQIIRCDTKITPDMLRYKIADKICEIFIEPHDCSHCGRNKDKK